MTTGPLPPPPCHEKRIAHTFTLHVLLSPLDVSKNPSIIIALHAEADVGGICLQMEWLREIRSEAWSVHLSCRKLGVSTTIRVSLCYFFVGRLTIWKHFPRMCLRNFVSFVVSFLWNVYMCMNFICKKLDSREFCSREVWTRGMFLYINLCKIYISIYILVHFSKISANKINNRYVWLGKTSLWDMKGIVNRTCKIKFVMR